MTKEQIVDTLCDMLATTSESLIRAVFVLSTAPTTIERRPVGRPSEGKADIARLNSEIEKLKEAHAIALQAERDMVDAYQADLKSLQKEKDRLLYVIKAYEGPVNPWDSEETWKQFALWLPATFQVTKEQARDAREWLIGIAKTAEDEWDASQNSTDSST